MTEIEAIAKVGWAKIRELGVANVRWIKTEQLWASETSRKVFALEWLEDNDERLIRLAASETLDPDDPADRRFWFRGVPRESEKDRIAKELNIMKDNEAAQARFTEKQDALRAQIGELSEVCYRAHRLIERTLELAKRQEDNDADRWPTDGEVVAIKDELLATSAELHKAFLSGHRALAKAA